jgi:hypothetical protein
MLHQSRPNVKAGFIPALGDDVGGHKARPYGTGPAIPVGDSPLSLWNGPYNPRRLSRTFQVLAMTPPSCHCEADVVSRSNLGGGVRLPCPTSRGWQ